MLLPAKGNNPIPKIPTVPAHSQDVWVQVLTEISQKWIPPASWEVVFLFWKSVFQ